MLKVVHGQRVISCEGKVMVCVLGGGGTGCVEWGCMVGPLAPSPLAYLIHNHDAKVQGELLQHELQHGCTLCMAKGTLAKVPATDANHRVLPKVLPELGHHLVQHASVSDSCLRAESACADGAVEIMQYSLVLQHGGGGGGQVYRWGGV